MLDYIELFKGNFVDVFDKRWKQNLELSTMNISKVTIRISPSFSKRNKLYSRGIWDDTSPLCVGENGEISTLDLIAVPFPRKN